jgi:molybdenum cofactor synthesis domain-containing protein
LRRKRDKHVAITVEVIAIGSELLLGDVLDTNTNWLCKRITGLGGRVCRAVLVRDDVKEIATEIRGTLTRGTDVVFTSGGLGPTTDDVTLVAVAEAASVPLELNPEALTLVRARYEELTAKGYVACSTLTEPRKKMARLPKGAKPLANPVGTAPGVVLNVGRTTIISLPGVPAELKGIFGSSLQPILKELFGVGVFVEKEVLIDCSDESALASVLEQVAEDNPGVYIKSLARRLGPKGKLRVTLSMAGGKRTEVEASIKKALGELKKALADAGLNIASIA